MKANINGIEVEGTVEEIAQFVKKFDTKTVAIDLPSLAKGGYVNPLPEHGRE